jgi:hypothetical protein
MKTMHHSLRTKNRVQPIKDPTVLLQTTTCETRDSVIGPLAPFPLRMRIRIMSESPQKRARVARNPPHYGRVHQNVNPARLVVSPSSTRRMRPGCLIQLPPRLLIITSIHLHPESLSSPVTCRRLRFAVSIRFTTQEPRTETCREQRRVLHFSRRHKCVTAGSAQQAIKAERVASLARFASSLKNKSNSNRTLSS